MKQVSQEESLAPPTWTVEWVAKELTEKIRGDMTDVSDGTAESVDGSDSITVYKHYKVGYTKTIHVSGFGIREQ
jgi:hypothetical protein